MTLARMIGVAVAVTVALLTLPASQATPLPKQQAIENPYRNVNLGDWAEYAVADSFGVKYTQRETVTAKNEKSIAIDSRQIVGPKFADIDKKLIALNEAFVLKWE